MPTTVKVRIYGARNLPAVQFAADEPTSTRGASGAPNSSIPIMDAYCTVTLGGHHGLVTDDRDAPWTLSSADAPAAKAAADSLEHANAESADSKSLTIQQSHRSPVLVQDKEDPLDALWQHHTSAHASVRGGDAYTHGNKSSRGRKVFAARTKTAAAQRVVVVPSAPTAAAAAGSLNTPPSSHHDPNISINPPPTILQWDEEFRFDVADDTVLQDEPLIFNVFDATSNNRRFQNTISRFISVNSLSTPGLNASTKSAPLITWDDMGDSSSSSSVSSSSSIGLVYVDLNPLLTLISNEDTKLTPSNSSTNNAIMRLLIPTRKTQH